MKKFFAWLQKYELIILSLIILLSFITKFYNLSYPAEYMFDEVYHVPTIHKIVAGDSAAFEWWHGELADELMSGTYIDWLHPPIAKYLGALSIIIFGDNSFAWRLPSALCGTIITFLVWYLAKLLFPKNTFLALLASFLIAIESLTRMQSRITMNDIVLVTFMLSALIFYLKYKKNSSWINLVGLLLTTGLAVGSKWTGIFLLPVFFASELWQIIINKKPILTSIILGGGLVGSTIIMYFASYWFLFYHHDLDHFLELHNQIWRYQMNLEATHPYSSPALTWPIGQKAIYYYYDSVTTKQLWARPTVPIFIVGILGILYSIFKILKNFKNLNQPEIYSLVFLNLFYFAVWLPWVFSPRIMFIYHYLPAIPILCILGGYLINDLLSFFTAKYKP